MGAAKHGCTLVNGVHQQVLVLCSFLICVFMESFFSTSTTCMHVNTL